MDSDDRGREWLRTTLYSIGDAVITTDALGRVREMNPVAEALTGWTEADAAGRAFAEVFVALNEDTRAAVADPVGQILREGLTIGLANHTLLVARDGTERPIADSGSPIRDRDGRILGAVLVFRDQTAERAQLRALEESERRHRELFVASPHAMWIYDDATLAFLEVNSAAVARYGYSREEFLAMTLADIRPAEDVPALLADVASVPDGFEGGRRWRHRRKDGSLLTVEISSNPVPWPGRTARVVLVHDVSAQAALETRLHWQAQMLTRLASREPLQALLDELAVFVGTLCPGVMSTVMLFDAGAGVLRPAASHLVPPEVQAAANPTPVAELSGVCGTAAARRAPFVVADIDTDPAFAAYLPVTRQFGLRAAWSHPFYDTGGRLLGTLAMYATTPRQPTRTETEVAAFAATLAGVMVERSRNLDALNEREAQLRLIFENEPECVKVLDRDGRLLEMNPAGLRLVEAESIEQVRGADVGSLVTPEHREAFKALTRAVAAGGEGRLEFELVGLKGSRRWMETHAAPLRDAQGRITAVLGITRDITERKALTAQLLQAQKLESVGRLAGGVAHDFNNMLSVIQGQTELALQDLPSGSPLEAGLREVLKAAQRSAQLTRQLLTFARREPSTPRPIDLERPDPRAHRYALAPHRRGRLGQLAARHQRLARAHRPGAVRSGADQPGRQRPRRDERRGHADGHDRQHDTRRRGRRRRRRLRGDDRRRHRRRDGCDHAVADLRAVLHDQTARPGHRSRALDGLRHRLPARRHDRDRQRSRHGCHLPAVPAAVCGYAGARSRTGGAPGRDRRPGHHPAGRG